MLAREMECLSRAITVGATALLPDPVGGAELLINPENFVFSHLAACFKGTTTELFFKPGD
jgi:hypothetical protein